MRDYGIMYLFHDLRARANMSAINCLRSVTLQWEWVMDVISLQTLC